MLCRLGEGTGPKGPATARLHKGYGARPPSTRPNTPKGARSSAVIYSVVETAKENGLNPFAYLTYLFGQLPNLDTMNPALLDDLLPWSANVPATCRVPAPSTR